MTVIVNNCDNNAYPSTAIVVLKGLFEPQDVQLLIYMLIIHFQDS